MSKDDKIDPLQALNDSLEEAYDWSSRVYDRATNILSQDPWKTQDLEVFDEPSSSDWAYPVPTVRQYSRCVDHNGTQGWSKDGVWRCLFGDSKKNMDLFSDYKGYLEFRRKLAKDNAETMATNFDEGQLLPENPKLISEEEAKGKNVISERVNVEVVTGEDGKLHKKKKVYRQYDDNTATVTETSKTTRGKWF